MQVKLNITGMKCGGCVSAVEEVLSQVDSVDSVDVSLEAKTAIVTGDVDSEALIAAIDSAGFKASLEAK